MSLYIVVASLFFMGQECPDEKTPRLKPSVEFHLSQETAARSYFSQKASDKGAARLFKISWPLWGVDVTLCREGRKPADDCVTIKELNVLPAQSYEVSERETIEAKP